MSPKVRYEIRKDKKKHEYALKINIKTNKATRIKLKTAKRGISRHKSEEKKQRVITQLKEEGAEGTYKEYQREIVKERRKVVERHKEKGKPPLTKGQIDSRAKKNVMKYHTGVACKYHYMWEYRNPIGTDATGMDICDDSPVYEEGRLDLNGSEHFDAMCEVCWDVYQHIANNACKSSPILGGACVIFYRKRDGYVFDMYELPETGMGCNRDFGFSFRKK